MARLVERRAETATASTLVLDVPGWPGHLPGQHVDVRLTAPDGYQAQRSYSLAAPADGDRIELTVQRVPGGEVTPYLTEVFAVGDPVEIRGPVGGWFVWRPEWTDPLLLVAGGSGIVPLMAMVRAGAPGRLLYSVRGPAEVFYRKELSTVDVSYVYTRTPPARRITRDDLDGPGPACYVCGPTGFVEAAADLLVSLGHDPGRVRTERFGPSGG